MMKEEFEKMSYRTVSVEEYAEIERDYMNLPDELNVSKEQFCKARQEARSLDMSVSNYLLLQKHIEAKHWEFEYRGEKNFATRCLNENEVELAYCKQRIKDLEDALSQQEVAA
jgi:hypothetical protein